MSILLGFVNFTLLLKYLELPPPIPDDNNNADNSDNDDNNSDTELNVVSTRKY